MHVAGTKGKGSTCKYVNGLLMERYQARLDEVKIGLYTSPHLCHVRERIRINSRPIEETVFTSRFFEIWHKLGLENDSKGSSGSRPGYFRFLTLLAFHVFKSYGVNIAIVEVGVGGKFDSTNIVPNPKVVAITNIHLDHQNQLGKTIEEIAWHKAGIMKTSAPAFTVPQKSAVQAVLSSRAAESNVALESITKQSWINILEDHMALNAALAVRVVGELFKLLRSPELSNDRDRLPMEREELSRGLAKTCLPARHEVVDFRESQWYLDGAHTKESVESAVLWFAGKVSHSNDT